METDVKESKDMICQSVSRSINDGLSMDLFHAMPVEGVPLESGTTIYNLRVYCILLLLVFVTKKSSWVGINEIRLKVWKHYRTNQTERSLSRGREGSLFTPD